VLKQEVLSGSLFTFCNQRRNRIRCLFFDGSGFWLATKRLEGATYQWPKDPAAVMQMSVAQLRLLLEGFELKSRRGWRRYEHRLAAGSSSAEAIATRSLKATVYPR
jgi:transposase